MPTNGDTYTLTDWTIRMRPARGALPDRWCAGTRPTADHGRPLAAAVSDGGLAVDAACRLFSSVEAGLCRGDVCCTRVRAQSRKRQRRGDFFVSWRHGSPRSRTLRLLLRTRGTSNVDLLQKYISVTHTWQANDMQGCSIYNIYLKCI